MKTRTFSFLLIFILFASVKNYGQVTSVPKEAKENFAKQYPAAQNVNWDNYVISATVHFELNGEKMAAEYNNKGIWKNTVQDFSFNSLPSAVQDGFKKSKYADRNIDEVKKIFYPGDVIRYRLKVEKNDLQKKFLFFNEKGRLVRESITI